MSNLLSPSKGSLPVRAWKRTVPSESTSLRGVTSFPVTCSGVMYRGGPGGPVVVAADGGRRRQLRRRRRLEEEASLEVGARRRHAAHVQNLESDGTAERPLDRPVHLAHPAPRERRYVLEAVVQDFAY